jgi:hypothetical protein
MYPGFFQLKKSGPFGPDFSLNKHGGRISSLGWRSQFAPEPARRFTGFHRVNKFDHTLMNTKPEGPSVMRASIVLVWHLGHGGRRIVIMMFRLIKRERNTLSHR